MLKVMLDMFRIDLDSAPSIRDALVRAGSQRFDLYVLDTEFPDGNGLNLCRTLRRVDPKVPVVFYSGNARPAEIESGMAAGAAEYITKPNSDKLAETIATLITNVRDRVDSGEESKVRSAA